MRSKIKAITVDRTTLIRRSSGMFVTPVSTASKRLGQYSIVAIRHPGAPYTVGFLLAA